MFGSVLFLALFETTLSISKNLPQICKNANTFPCVKPEKLIPWTECGEYLPACDAKRCCTDKMIQVDSHWLTTVYRSYAHVDARFSDGSSALMNAALWGYTSDGGRLIARKASLNLQANNDGMTALSYAIFRLRVDFVKMLLQANASTAATAVGSPNALSRAVSKWYFLDRSDAGLRIIELLLDYCADVDEKPYFPGAKFLVERLSQAHKNPLIAAVLRNSMDGLKRILKNMDVCMRDKSIDSTETTDEGEWSALTHATSMSNVEMMDILLEHNAQIGPELAVAAKRGYLEIGKKLIGKGANVSAGNDAALVAAVENNQTAFAYYLLEKGASFNAKDKDGKTVLMLAATKNNDLVKHLLKSSEIEVNAMDKDGKSALMVVVASCFADNIKSLVDDSRINVSARDISGLTALMQAVRCPVEVFKLLLKRAGATVNMRDYRGRPALLHAVDRCNADVVSVLLQGNLINMRYMNSETILMRAVKTCDVDVVDLLLSHPSIQINAKSGEVTALMMAVEANRSIDIVDRLLNQANVSTAPTESKCDSALFRAVKKNRTDIVKSLLAKIHPDSVYSPSFVQEIIDTTLPCPSDTYWRFVWFAFLLIPLGLLMYWFYRIKHAGESRLNPNEWASRSSAPVVFCPEVS